MALAQTKLIIEDINKFHPEIDFEIVIIKTEGDIKLEHPLFLISGKGVFVKELEDALIQNKIDIAAHSLKDMPTSLPDGLNIACIPEREDPSDILVIRNNLAGAMPDALSLPPYAKVGTSSLRRAAQLLAFRRDLCVAPIRGNIDTRIKKLLSGDFDAIVLAYSGLIRLGIEYQDIIFSKIQFDVMLPSPGQGALAIETRRGEFSDILSCIHSKGTACAVEAERRVLLRLGGGCKTPVGCLGIIDNGQLFLRACVCKVDGSVVLREEYRGSSDKPLEAADYLADSLLKKGADKLLIC